MLIKIFLCVWKEPRCPSKDEWIKKMWSMYTMEYYSTDFSLPKNRKCICKKLEERKLEDKSCLCEEM